VAGTILVLLAVAGGGLGLAGYRLPTLMQLGQNPRVTLARVALLVGLSGAALALAEVVVAVVRAIRDHRAMPDRPQTRPWFLMLLGLSMLLFTMGLLTSPR
jgi:hypothetical protein